MAQYIDRAAATSVCNQQRAYGTMQIIQQLPAAKKDTSKMLDTLTFNGRADAIDCREYVKNRYGIDLDELPWELEIEK